ncbi:TPA: hypothetical protein ACG1DY_005029, partial [Escherichia coli]
MDINAGMDVYGTSYFNSYALFYGGISISSGGLSVSGLTDLYGTLNVYSSIGASGDVYAGSGTYGYFRHRANSSNYMRLSDAGAGFWVKGTNKVHWASLPRVRVEPSGDGILDGKEFQVNNPGSMQPLLMDFINIKIDSLILPNTKKVYIDEKFKEFIGGYSVFLTNGKVIEKNPDYFVVQGSGEISCLVMGIQRGKEDVVGYEFVDVQMPRRMLEDGQLEPLERDALPRKLRQGGYV